MALRRKGRLVTHLPFLLTYLLLSTGGVRSTLIGEEPITDIEADGGSGAAGKEAGMEATEDVLRAEEGVVVAENGTSEAVVLDCPHDLDGNDAAGLTIKWYYHQPRATLVYQWILNREPEAISKLRGRVDLSYEASQDAFHRYSAIRILHPTTDIAGHYECRVSSYTMESTFPRDLVVFRKPSTLDVQAEANGEDQVNVTCQVEEVFPQPVLHLYKKSPSKDSEMLKGVTRVTSFMGKTYNMQVEKVVDEVTLNGPTEFECVMGIPKTKVKRSTYTKYQPRVSITTGAVTTGSNTQRASAVLLLVLSFLVCLLYG